MKHTIGIYTLDTEANSVHDNRGTELEMEQQVYDVFVYLNVNKNRYVPIAELHEKLWAGKVVTDSAVRKAIAKLRAKLATGDPDTTYIKSAPKKGYRLATEVSIVAAEVHAAAKGVDKSHSVLFSRAWSKRFFWPGVFVLVVLVVVSSLSVSRFETMNTLHGFKPLIDVHQSLLTYVNQSRNSHATQILVSDYQQAVTHEIPWALATPQALKIINENTLGILLKNQQQCRLYIQSILTSDRATEAKPAFETECQNVHGFSVNYNNQSLYLALTEAEGSPIDVISIDGQSMLTETLIRFPGTASTFSQIQINADASRFAAIQTEPSGVKHIVVIDAKSGLKLSKSEPVSVSHLRWGNDNTLLVSNEDGIVQLTENRSKLLIEDSRIEAIAYSGEHLFFTRQRFDVTATEGKNAAVMDIGADDTEIVKVNRLLGEIDSPLNTEQTGLTVK